MDFRKTIEQGRGTGKSDLCSEFGKNIQSEFFGIEHSNAVPACLDLRMQQGTRIALPYSFFTHLSFDTEIGIELFTNNKKITVTGRNLSKLYDYLIRYRVRYIQCNVGNDESEEGLFVKTIQIEEIGM